MKRLTLVLLTVAGAVMELAGLALFVPLLLLLLERGGVSNSVYLSRLYNLLNVTNYGTFLLLVCGFVLTFTILKNYLIYKINSYKTYSLLKIYRAYSGKMFRFYFDKGLSYIKEKGASALSHNTNAVCYSYVFFVLAPSFTIAGELLLSVLIIGILAGINVYVAATEVVLFLPLLIIYQMSMGKRLYRAGKVDNEAKKGQWRLTLETFRGYPEVFVNGAFKRMEVKFDEGLNAVSDSRIKSDKIKSAASGMIETGVMLVITGVVVTSYYLNNGKDLLVEIGLFAIATLKLLPAAKSVISNYATIRSNRYTKEILSEMGVKYVWSDRVSEAEEEILAEPLPFENQIEFKNVTFGYSDREPVLKNISFTIRKGEKIGIKGVSGVGKSTLFYLLLGLYEPVSGEILIDQAKLTPQNRSRWHKRLGYVSQDIFIMDSSLAENIALASKINTDRLTMVVERSSLNGLTEKMPMGIQTRIGEGGCMLSGGERQRVAIARAIYKDADVFLLDEPTSSLDRKTEEEITATIQNPAFSKQNITMVIISHDDNLLGSCDRIITID